MYRELGKSVAGVINDIRFWYLDLTVTVRHVASILLSAFAIDKPTKKNFFVVVVVVVVSILTTCLEFCS